MLAGRLDVNVNPHCPLPLPLCWAVKAQISSHLLAGWDLRIPIVWLLLHFVGVKED